MKLFIDGETRQFIEIQVFRELFGLPDDFGLGLFSSKDYTGLGSIQGAGAALNQIRQEILAAIPQNLSIHQWLPFLPAFQELFRQKLIAANTAVGLREVEIDFAMAGLGDVCHAYIYALISAKASGQSMPDFGEVYQTWLNESVRIFPEQHHYSHNNQVWSVQVIAHVYGRAGLIVQTKNETFYVHDARLGCPAEGFMASLLEEICTSIVKKLT